MIYGKIWCVVRPQVGVPMMLAAVAIGSFCVHYAILTHTTWVPKFLEGKPAATAAAPAAPAAAGEKK